MVAVFVLVNGHLFTVFVLVIAFAVGIGKFKGSAGVVDKRKSYRLSKAAVLVHKIIFVVLALAALVLALFNLFISEVMLSVALGYAEVVLVGLIFDIAVLNVLGRKHCRIGVLVQQIARLHAVVINVIVVGRLNIGVVFQLSSQLCGGKPVPFVGGGAYNSRHSVGAVARARPAVGGLYKINGLSVLNVFLARIIEEFKIAVL